MMMLRARMSEVKFKVRLNALLLREFTTDQVVRITGLKPESVRTELQRMKAEGLLEVARGAALADQKRPRGGQPLLYRLTPDPEKRLALSRSVEAFYPEAPQPQRPTSRHFVLAIRLLDQASTEKGARKREQLFAQAEEELDFALIEEGASRAPVPVRACIELQRGRLAYLHGQDEQAETLLHQARQASMAAGQLHEAALAAEFLLCIAARRRWVAEGDYQPQARAVCILEELRTSGFQSGPLMQLMADLLGELSQTPYDEVIRAVMKQALAASQEAGRKVGRMEERLSQREPGIWGIERQEQLGFSRMSDSMRPPSRFERAVFSTSQDFSLDPRRRQRHDA